MSVNAVGYSAPKVDISSAEVVVKTDPPVLTLEPITDDGVINIAEHGGAIKVSGTVQDNIPGTSINTAVGRTLSLSLGAVSYSAVVQSNGSWEVMIAAGDVGALSGSSSYSAQASYSGVYGNTGSSTRSVALDLSAPAMPNAQLNSDTGASDAAYVTTDVRINAPTNTEAQASLAYRVTASGQASGAWSSSYSAPTQDGAYTVQVRQTDAAGNASAIQSLSFVRDTTAPSFDSASTQAVNENVASGSWVYTAAASDANGG